jgi:hypothetical protein
MNHGERHFHLRGGLGGGLGSLGVLPRRIVDDDA